MREAGQSFRTWQHHWLISNDKCFRSERINPAASQESKRETPERVRFEERFISLIWLIGYAGLYKLSKLSNKNIFWLKKVASNVENVYNILFIINQSMLTAQSSMHNCALIGRAPKLLRSHWSLPPRCTRSLTLQTPGCHRITFTFINQSMV